MSAHRVELVEGDIIKADAEALVNSVNCVGIMGRGIALQFRKAFPDNYKSYAAACDRHEVEPGHMFVFETHALTNPKYIINFPTKRHWRGKSRMEDIEAGLDALVEEIKSRGITSIAVPPLGSGLGGLDWSLVEPLITFALSGAPDVHALVYKPSGAPAAAKMAKAAKVPTMTPGRAALVGLIQRYLDGLLEPFISLLELHKLMYFMQEAGEPLKLKYVKAIYGPYAENLRQVLIAIEGYMTFGYAEGGDQPGKLIQIVPGATEEAEPFLAAHPETLARFERVVDLVSGFETPFGLELLATVHWVATYESAFTTPEVIEKTYAWNDRKMRFSRDQITMAADVLSGKGWMELQSSIA